MHNQRAKQVRLLAKDLTVRDSGPLLDSVVFLSSALHFEKVQEGKSGRSNRCVETCWSTYGELLYFVAPAEERDGSLELGQVFPRAHLLDFFF